MKALSPELLIMVSLGVGIVPLGIAIGTCYLKFSIVLSLLRSGFGTQQAPSNSLVMALSMVMSLIVMNPIINEVSTRVGSIRVADVGGASVGELIQKGVFVVSPWRRFLILHSGERELITFHEMTPPGERGVREGPSDISLITALASFVVSEIKKGFLIAFLLLLPFFVIDVVVANVLVAMGLTMMSPSTVSLPLKLLLFISSDGWFLLVKSLVTAYR